MKIHPVDAGCCKAQADSLSEVHLRGFSIWGDVNESIY